MKHFGIMMVSALIIATALGAPRKLFSSSVKIVTNREEITAVKKEKKWESIFGNQTPKNLPAKSELPDTGNLEEERIHAKKKKRESAPAPATANSPERQETRDDTVFSVSPDNEMPDSGVEKKEEKKAEEKKEPAPVSVNDKPKPEETAEKKINSKRLERAKEIHHDNAKRTIRDHKVNF